MLVAVASHATSPALVQRVADAVRDVRGGDRTLLAADALAAAIALEAPGARLPSLRMLARVTGLHRNTLRAALELLAREGAVEREPHGRYRTLGGDVVVVLPEAPWPWLDAVLGPAGPLAAPAMPLAKIDPDWQGLVLAAEIELDAVRARLARAEVLGVGASVIVDVELGLADVPAGRRVRVDAPADVEAAVRRVVADVRPDLVTAATGPADVVLMPVGAVATTDLPVRRFRTAPGNVELQLVAARVAHHGGPPTASASSASSSGSAARQ
jgi:Bacterial regulatory proteins, gntR family